jgi:hypothetical protein
MYWANATTRDAATVRQKILVQQMALPIFEVIIILYAVTDVDIGRGSNAHGLGPFRLTLEYPFDDFSRTVSSKVLTMIGDNSFLTKKPVGIDNTFRLRY